MTEATLFTDSNVRGDLIKALRQRGREVHRAVDLFGQWNDDAELFAHKGRASLPDVRRGDQVIAHDWLPQGRMDFRMIYCTMEHQQEMAVGELLEGIEEILQKDAFPDSMPVRRKGPNSSVGPCG